MAEKKASLSKKKKKAKKPKVRLSARKVYLLCAAIFAVCAVSLATSVFLTERSSAVQSASVAKTAQTQPKSAAKETVPAQQTQQAPKAAPAQQQPVVPAQKPAAPVQMQPAVQPQSVVQQKQPAVQPQSAVQQNQPTTQQQQQPTKSVAPSTDSTKALASAKTDKSQKTPAQQKPSAPQKQPEPSPAKASPQQAPAAPTSAPQSAPAKQTSASKPVSDPFNLPPAKNGATLVFVIDDAGLHVDNVKKYTSLPFPLAIAVLPKLSHTKECASLIRKDGKELMLHQPMQAINLNINPGAGKISPDMNTYQIAAQIKENIAELGGGVKGFNNHEGSLITEDEIKMGAVLETAASLGVYFLDSRTSAQSKARQAALERDMHIFERNAPFLDNAVNREEMLAEIKKGLAVANKAGYAIIIGHVDKSAQILPQLLSELYPHLQAKGYRFATPSTL